MPTALEQTEAESQAISKGHPRVTLADIEGNISQKFFATGDQIVLAGENQDDTLAGETLRQLKVFTICILVMRNGFMVNGCSAPASPENFDAEYGKQLAYEDCIRQLWRLEGYSLRTRLAAT